MRYLQLHTEGPRPLPVEGKGSDVGNDRRLSDDINRKVEFMIDLRAGKDRLQNARFSNCLRKSP